MLNIILEFRKGVLFVRISGVLNKETVVKFNDEVSCMAKENGIRNIVLNLEELEEIDLKGINSLFYIYEIAKNNKGRFMICGINDNIKKRILKSHLLNYVMQLDSEIDCFYKVVI